MRIKALEASLELSSYSKGSMTGLLWNQCANASKFYCTYKLLSETQENIKGLKIRHINVDISGFKLHTYNVLLISQSRPPQLGKSILPAGVLLFKFSAALSLLILESLFKYSQDGNWNASHALDLNWVYRRAGT